MRITFLILFALTAIVQIGLLGIAHAAAMNVHSEPPLTFNRLDALEGSNNVASGDIDGDSAKPMQWSTVSIPATITLPPDRRVTSVWVSDMVLLYTAGDGSCYSVTGLASDASYSGPPNPNFGQSCAPWLFADLRASNGTSYISLIYDAYPIAIGVTAATALGGQETYFVEDITQSQQPFTLTPFKTVDPARSQGMLVTRTVTIDNITIQQCLLIGGTSAHFEVFCVGNCADSPASDTTQAPTTHDSTSTTTSTARAKQSSLRASESDQSSPDRGTTKSYLNNPVASWRRMMRWADRKRLVGESDSANNSSPTTTFRSDSEDVQYYGWGWRSFKAHWPSHQFPIICAGYASAVKNGTIFISGGYNCATGEASANVYGLDISPNGTWVNMWQVSPWVLGSKMDDTFINGFFGLAAFDIYLIAAVSNACGILALYSMTQNTTYSISSGAQILSHVVEDPSLANCVGPQHFMHSSGRVMLLTSADMDQLQVQGYLSFGNLIPLDLASFTYADIPDQDDVSPADFLRRSVRKVAKSQVMTFLAAMGGLEEDSSSYSVPPTAGLFDAVEDSDASLGGGPTYLVDYGPSVLNITVGNASAFTDVGIYTTRDCIGRVPFATTLYRSFDANASTVTVTISIDPRGVKRAFEQWDYYSGRSFPPIPNSEDIIHGTRYSYFDGLAFICASPGACPTYCRDTSQNGDDETDPSRQYMYVHDPNYCAVGYAPDMKIGNDLIIDNYYHCNRTESQPASILEFPWAAPGGELSQEKVQRGSVQGRVESVTFYHAVSESPVFFAPPPSMFTQTRSQTLSAVLPTNEPKDDTLLPFSKTIQILIIVSATIFGLIIVVLFSCCVTWYFACFCFKPQEEEDEYLYFDDWASNPNRSHEKGAQGGSGLRSAQGSDVLGFQKPRKSEYYLRGQDLEEDVRHNRNEGARSGLISCSSNGEAIVSKDHSINDGDDATNTSTAPALDNNNNNRRPSGRRPSRQYLSPNDNKAIIAANPKGTHSSSSQAAGEGGGSTDPNSSLPSSNPPGVGGGGDIDSAQNPTRPALPHREDLGLDKSKPPSSLGVSTQSEVQSTRAGSGLNGTTANQQHQELRAPSPVAITTAQNSNLSNKSKDKTKENEASAKGVSRATTPVDRQQQKHSAIVGDDTIGGRAPNNALALTASPYSPYADSDTSSSRLTSAAHSETHFAGGRGGEGATPVGDRRGPPTPSGVADKGLGSNLFNSGANRRGSAIKRRPVGEALRSIPVFGLLLGIGGGSSLAPSPRGAPRSPMPGSPHKQSQSNAGYQAAAPIGGSTLQITDRNRAVDQSFESAPTMASGIISGTSTTASGFRRAARRRNHRNSQNANGVTAHSDEDDVQSLATTDGGGINSRNSLGDGRGGQRGESSEEEEAAKPVKKHQEKSADSIRPGSPTSAAALFNNNSGSQKYLLERLLGRGGYGMVFLARRTTDGTSIALKYIKCANESDLESALNEFEILHRLRHSNIVPILDMFLNWQDGFKPVLMKKAHQLDTPDEVGRVPAVSGFRDSKEGESSENSPSQTPAQRASDAQEQNGVDGQHQSIATQAESPSAPVTVGNDNDDGEPDYYPSNKQIEDPRLAVVLGEEDKNVALPPPPKPLPSTAPEPEPPTPKLQAPPVVSASTEKEGTRYVAIATKFLPEGDLKRLVTHRIQITGGGQGAGAATEASPYDSNNSQASAFSFNQSVKRFHESHIISLSIQMASALLYLHTRTPRVVHRDLKPENVLMDRNGQIAVLTDFGLAHGDSTRTMGTQAGSLPYVSPEAWSGRYTEKVDVWALGCVIYGICTLRVSSTDVLMMFDAVDDDDFVKNITYDLCNACGYSPELAELVCAMLTKAPPKRISIAEALIWLKGIVAIRSYSTSFVQQMPSKDELLSAMEHVPTSQDSAIIARVAQFADEQHLSAMKHKYEAMVFAMQQLRRKQGGAKSKR